jgi:hypothetical protein
METIQEAGGFDPNKSDKSDLSGDGRKLTRVVWGLFALNAHLAARGWWALLECRGFLDKMPKLLLGLNTQGEGERRGALLFLFDGAEDVAFMSRHLAINRKPRRAVKVAEMVAEVIWFFELGE